MLTLDGSVGEGGGQILRTALSLSMVTGQPFRIERIRANRKKPGLLHQHLTAVSAAQTISQAKVEGATPGSSHLTFEPRTITPGEYRFAIGTAGSVTLVFQTVLPALMLAGTNSRIVLEGGTHNTMAPPYDFLAKTFLPLLHKMGPGVCGAISRYGFYPSGGGQLEFTIEPSAKLTPLELLERGPITHRLARALAANLPVVIAERELEEVMRQLDWPEDVCKSESVRSVGPGNALLIEMGSASVLEIVTGYGERAVPAKAVAAKAAQEARRYLDADVPVGEHLADQLLIPFALAGGGAFKTLPLSSHATTNIEVIQRFLPLKIEVEETGGKSYLVRFGAR